MNLDKKKKLHNIIFCFLLMGALVLFDQLVKIFIVNACAPYQVYKNFFGDLINIRLVYNTGAAFSLGSKLTGFARLFILLLLPIAGLLALMLYALFSQEVSNAQRLFIFGILGGGTGNLIDRIFRAEGVVDFIDVKFFGIFGLERWPTFNIADATVIIFGSCLFVSIIIAEIREKKLLQQKA